MKTRVTAVSLAVVIMAVELPTLEAQFSITANVAGSLPAGSLTTNGPGSFTVVGGGADIWDAEDQFFFAYDEINGDFDVRVRVEALEVVNVWTKAGFYDPAKGSVLTWIFTIARNLRIDRIRRESSRPVSELGDFDAPSEAPASEEILAQKDEARSVARALTKIPPEQMEILTLSFIEDLPQAEIARRLKLPLGTVKSRMRLAYGHLRKTLEQPN